MMPAPANQGQGGGGGALWGVLVPPMSGRWPDCIIEEGENRQVIPNHLCPYPPFNFPPKMVPNMGFPAGGFIDNPSEEVPSTYNGRSLFPLDACTKTLILQRMPNEKVHLEFTSRIDNEDPGTVMQLENATRTRSGLYLQKEFYSRAGLPKYWRNGGHLELVQGRECYWTPLTIPELKQYLILKGRPDLAEQVFLKKNSLRFIWYGDLRFIPVSHPFQNYPSVTGFFWNGLKYCLESEQPPNNAFQYARAIIKSIREHDYNSFFRIRANGRDRILAEISRRMLRAVGPVAAADQPTGVEPHPDQAAVGGGVEGQPQPEQLPALPVGAAHQPTGVEPHPDQEAAGSSVSAQPHQEHLPAGPAAAQGQVVGVGPQSNQGRAGVGGDGQSDQPTPPVNPGATPRTQVSDAAQTLVRGESRGRDGGPGGFRDARPGGFRRARRGVFRGVNY